jgi:hypothetical protein
MLRSVGWSRTDVSGLAISKIWDLTGSPKPLVLKQLTLYNIPEDERIQCTTKSTKATLLYTILQYSVFGHGSLFEEEEKKPHAHTQTHAHACTHAHKLKT